VIPQAHEGYITWEEYEDNLRLLRENSQAFGSDRRRSPPREGPALLQGLVVCGRCGLRMTVRYNVHRGVQVPTYVCQRMGIERGESPCQRVSGGELDEAIGSLILEAVTPLTLEVALAVGDELRVRAEEVDGLRRQHVERARYEAELAERRYRRVDPDHRLVADTLEADWNHKLRALVVARETYERQRKEDQGLLDEGRRAEILALATDFPRLWTDPSTPCREKKRMTRLVIEDVTLLRGAELTAHVRFTGGASRTLKLPLPRNVAELRRTDPAVVMRIDELLDDHTEEETASALNAEGIQTGTELRFNRQRVNGIRKAYSLRTRYQRLRAEGMLTLEETAADLQICTHTVKIWRAAGLLPAHPYNAKNQCLYEPSGPDRPTKNTWKGLSTYRKTSSPSTA
jgi:hypothetical protein